MNQSNSDATTSLPFVTVVVCSADYCLALYDEQFGFGDFGAVAISRASYVEPDAAGRWEADLSPVGGPVLGPFPLRSQALDAERAWLNRHLHQLPRHPRL
jgi:hypothetical protein